MLAKVKLRLYMFRKVSSVANIRARLMYGYGLIFSCFYFCIAIYGSSDPSYLRKVISLYNKSIRNIAGLEYRNNSTEEIRAALNIFSFEQARQYFDIITFNKIVLTRQPVNLNNLIQRDFPRETRSTESGNLRIIGVPRSEKMRRSYMYRACSEYNKVPRELRELDLNQQKKFKDCLKRWILGRPYVLARGMNLFNNGLEYDIGVG